MDEANEPGKRYGTVGCAAPEQYKKEGILDERTDIYAIGVICNNFMIRIIDGEDKRLCCVLSVYERIVAFVKPYSSRLNLD
jgi:serine/threonine protein kinase